MPTWRQINLLRDAVPFSTASCYQAKLLQRMWKTAVFWLQALSFSAVSSCWKWLQQTLYTVHFFQIIPVRFRTKPTVSIWHWALNKSFYVNDCVQIMRVERKSLGWCCVMYHLNLKTWKQTLSHIKRSVFRVGWEGRGVSGRGARWGGHGRGGQWCCGGVTLRAAAAALQRYGSPMAVWNIKELTGRGQ